MEAGTANPQPAFAKLDYRGVNSINYLSDFTNLSHANWAYLESLNAVAPVSLERKEQSKFDNIASELYKRIVKQGYVERPSNVTKKAKRGDTDFNFYNTNDDFIDDEEIIEKKDIFTQYSDYHCLPVTSIDDLYNSQQYKAKAEEVVSESLKRQAPDHFNPDNLDEMEKFHEVKKKIKSTIRQLITNKMNTPQANVQEMPVAAPANPLALDPPHPPATTVVDLLSLNRQKSREPIVIDDDPPEQRDDGV